MQLSDAALLPCKAQGSAPAGLEVLLDGMLNMVDGCMQTVTKSTQILVHPLAPLQCLVKSH